MMIVIVVAVIADLVGTILPVIPPALPSGRKLCWARGALTSQYSTPWLARAQALPWPYRPIRDSGATGQS
ncbi:MAG: hypothetical protein IPI28_13080 [Candidatus Omnitrophica bacterium]|nr:hypothetical protein [Candidatus Omnitrophota bacterium]